MGKRQRSINRGRNENMLDQSMAERLDELSAFEEFKESILPAIRKDLNAGLSASEIRKKYASIVQASMVTTALIDPNPAARLTAGKDILDRDEGKAKENKTVEHKFSHLSDEQLNAMLISEEAEVADLEDDNDEA